MISASVRPVDGVKLVMERSLYRLRIVLCCMLLSLLRIVKNNCNNLKFSKNHSHKAFLRVITYFEPNLLPKKFFDYINIHTYINTYIHTIIPYDQTFYEFLLFLTMEMQDSFRRLVVVVVAPSLPMMIIVVE